MKIKICFILLGISIAFTCACSERQNTIKIAAAKDKWFISPEVPEQSDNETTADTDSVIAPDLNHNGIAEEVRLIELDNGQGRQLEIWENSERLHVETSYYTNPGWVSIFLCTLDGEDYLLRYCSTMYQRTCYYSYRLSSLAEGKDTIIQMNQIDFDINFGSPIHSSFDPEAIVAFMDEVNDLFSHSIQMLCIDSNLLNTFKKEGRLYDSLWWLDDWEPDFIRDENKSLLENLKDFRNTMSALQESIKPEAIDELPITETLGMSFYSGAGAWQTFLGLNPDGSFVGEYSDADADKVYLCYFHGRFGKVEKLTDASWLLTLEELELDTGCNVGEEWDVKDGDYTLHFHSSNPYGFEDMDGAALKPGAQFILYSPDAVGHEPGTELYGALEFQTWMHPYRQFHSAGDNLGFWGLQNLETGQGFFEDARYDELEDGRVY